MARRHTSKCSSSYNNYYYDYYDHPLLGSMDPPRTNR